MIQRILVAVDRGEASRAAVDHAIDLARICGARLRLLHLLDELKLAPGFETYGAQSEEVFRMIRESGRGLLEGHRSRIAAAGVPVDAVLVEGFGRQLSEAIADNATAWHADLIVVGTEGRSGLKLLLHGSDAQAVARSAPVPVMMVRARPRGADGGGGLARPHADASGLSPMFAFD